MQASKESGRYDEDEDDGASRRTGASAEVVVVPTKKEDGTPKLHHHEHLSHYKNVQELFSHTIARLKLSKAETSFQISEGAASIDSVLNARGNVFAHDTGYRAGKWITHVATLGMNRLRRWNIFPGEIGFALHTPSNTIFQLLPGQHYLRPLVYSSATRLTLPTGLEARPCISYLNRMHIVKVRSGDVCLVTVNGVQRILGKGFHFFEARNFQFDAKHFLAKTNYIRHGNQHRIFVPRGSAFTAIINQQPVLLPHRSSPYLFNTPRFQLPPVKQATQCFVRIGQQDIEHRSIKVFLVPKGFRVFAKYRGDPLVFEHNPIPYVIDDPLFQWGGRDFLTSRLPLSISYAGLLGLHYVRVPKGQLLLVMINGRVSAIANDPNLGDVPQIYRSPNLQPIAFVSTAQRFVSCGTWNRVLVRCGEVCLAWHKNKAVRLEARAEPHVIQDDDCFRLRSNDEELNDSTIEANIKRTSSRTATRANTTGGRSMTKLASVRSNTLLQSDVPSLMSMRPSEGVVIRPGVGWWVLPKIAGAFKALSMNYHHGPYVQKTVPPGFWGLCRVNSHVTAFLDRFTSQDAGDFKMIGLLPAVEQLIELQLKDVRAADHRLNIKVDFIFKIVDAQKALRSLIPVDMIDQWKGLMEERAKSVVTALLPRVQSNLTIRNLGNKGHDDDDESGKSSDAGDRHTFAENFSAEVSGSWGQSYINKAFINNGIILVSFTPSEVHLTDAKTKLRLEESAREASLQEMEVQKISKAFEANAAKLRADMELQKMQQKLELTRIENERQLLEKRNQLKLQTAEAESNQSKIRADAASYAAEKSKASGAFTKQQLEVEKLKIIAQCFSNISYTGPQMMQQQQALVASMLSNMGMGHLVPSMSKLLRSNPTGGRVDSKRS